MISIALFSLSMSIMTSVIPVSTCQSRVTASIVRLMGVSLPKEHRGNRLPVGGPARAWARYLSNPICSLSERFEMDPLLVAAVMRSESNFDFEAISLEGKDLGLMQIRRGITTRGFDRLTDRQLMRPWVNTYLGIRRLRLARHSCPLGSDTAIWLGRYAGNRCGPSRYGKTVMYFYSFVVETEETGHVPDAGLN